MVFDIQKKGGVGLGKPLQVFGKNEDKKNMIVIYHTMIQILKWKETSFSHKSTYTGTQIELLNLGQTHDKLLFHLFPSCWTPPSYQEGPRLKLSACLDQKSPLVEGFQSSTCRSRSKKKSHSDFLQINCLRLPASLGSRSLGPALGRTSLGSCWKSFSAPGDLTKLTTLTPKRSPMGFMSKGCPMADTWKVLAYIHTPNPLS